MSVLIEEIKGFLLRHKKYIINIMYSGHADDPDQYYFHLTVDGSRCLLKVNASTMEKKETDQSIHQLDEELGNGNWFEDHQLEL